MGSILSLLIATMLVGGSNHPPADTTTFADASTRALVLRAMARHRAQDSTVEAYQAKIRYRLSFALGKRAWADLPTVAVEEQDANISWQRPNDLRVDLLGTRRASQIEDLNLASTFSRPWFVPRTLGDSIRIFGSRTPRQAAPHPLSAGGPAHYHFAAGDSVTITTGGHTITIRSVIVEPKGIGRSYVAGKLWLDVNSGDVARFTFRFIGTDQWDRPNGNTAADSAESERSNQFISRILQIDADLEYGLQDNKYWMPFRQVISGRVTIPFGVELAIPFQASTTFSDYEINAGTSVVFTAPFPVRGGRGGGEVPIPLARGGGRGGRGNVAGDTTARFRNDSTLARERVGIMAGGGRYQIHRPPADSLKAYTAWSDSLSFEVTDADRRHTREATADLAHIVEGLPGEMTGKPKAGIGLERLGEAFRYNRVEGTALSFSGRLPLPIAFTESFGTVRYGFADHRVMATLSIRRDSPSSRWTVTGGRDLVDLDPFSKGLNFGNGVRAALTGHDDGAYLLAQGVRGTYETSVGLGKELTLTAIAEDQRSVGSAGRAGLPRLFGSNGYFPENPGVTEGFAAGAGMRLEHGLFGTRWRIDAQVLKIAGDQGGRVAADLTIPELLSRNIGAHFVIGAATGTATLPQLELRAGSQGTVRGFEFNSAHGDALWAAQVDVSLRSKGFLRPVIFADAGQAGHLGSLREQPVLVGGGAGLLILDGLVRLELSHPITARDGRGLRFDLVFGGFR